MFPMFFRYITPGKKRLYLELITHLSFDSTHAALDELNGRRPVLPAADEIASFSVFLVLRADLVIHLAPVYDDHKCLYCLHSTMEMQTRASTSISGLFFTGRAKCVPWVRPKRSSTVCHINFITKY